MPSTGPKALVLTAGAGTRLLPHTLRVPKPLFPIAGRPIVDIIIKRLIGQGISAVAVNTHHLHRQVENFIGSSDYCVPVLTRYEPEMLGTGGAIRNFADFLGSFEPFIVINSDILTDIDAKKAAEQHAADASCAATLIVQDCPEFNKVRIDENGLIRDFSGTPAKNETCLAFTGIQVADPLIYDYIPPGPHVDIIEVYRLMIKSGLKIKALKSEGHFWYDIGTPQRFRRAAADSIAPEAFKKAFGIKPPPETISWQQLAGDGSDRSWFMLLAGKKSLVMADHGIQSRPDLSEFDSYVSIGTHLQKKGIPVPQIHESDRFSGLVFLEDLGDTLLQTAIFKAADKKSAENLCRRAVEEAVDMSTGAIEGLCPRWCWQEPAFSRQTVTEKEGMYFVTAFLRGFLAMENIETQRLKEEFELIADVIENCGITGFMHRDLQCRNIMVTGRGLFFIDFQGARKGPVQYDLASLITDPYSDLDADLRKRLLNHAAGRLAEKTGGLDMERFFKGYTYCAVSRNLQALGAYGHLCTNKAKPGFKTYMKPAAKNLCSLLKTAADPGLPWLSRTAARALSVLENTV